MATTRELRDIVEPVVVEWLEKQFGTIFVRDRALQIGTKHDGTAARHRFDAVSLDASGSPAIVAEVTTHSGKTSGGKGPNGKVDGTYRDLYPLSLVTAPVRIMVLTDPAFSQYLTERSDGKVAPGISMVFCGLPADVQQRVSSVQGRSSREMGADQ